MTGPASRRGFLRGAASLPLAGGGLALITAPALAAPLTEHERRWLALGPTLVPMLNEYDRLWAPVHGFYEAWERATERPGWTWDRRVAHPAWAAYIAAREPADDLGARLDEMVEPFVQTAFSSLPAIMLAHRYGMTFEHWREGALTHLDRLWGRERCA